MRFRTTFKLLIAVVILGVFTFLLNREFRPTQTAAPASQRVMDRIRTSSITGLTIKGIGPDIVCSRQNGAWLLLHPIEAEADEAVISSMIAALEAMRRDEVISTIQRQQRSLSLNDYGLEPPRASLRLSDGTGAQEVLIGTNAPLGSSVYVKLADGDDVLATSPLIVDALPANVGILRDRSLLRGEPSSTYRVEIRQPDGALIRLVRDHDRWSIQQPISGGANDERIKQMLGVLYSTRISSFVWDPPAGTSAVQSPTHTPPVRLTAENARLKISVWSGDDDAGRTLLLGQDADAPDRLYVKRAEREAIYTISNQLLNAFSVHMDELRDRDIFPMDPSLVRRLEVRHNDRKMVLRRTEEGWHIVEPLRCKADEATVEQAVRKLALAQILSFGGTAAATGLVQSSFAGPAFSITMDTSAAETTPERDTSTTVTIGPPAPGQPGSIYALLGASNDLVVAEDSLASALGARPADPLAYRDRTVLAIAPDSIARIRVTRGIDTFEIHRSSPDTWVPSAPMPGTVRSNALTDIMLALAGLRATRLEGYAESNIAAYGLDKPAATILVEVTDESTASYKSILLGFLAGTDGVYAMVQGQDVVFVLDHGMAELLTRDLIAPPPPTVPSP